MAPLWSTCSPCSTRVRFLRADEEFVVKKKLMFPCIALASAVVDPEQTTAEVDVDCLTFDRVLLYLEVRMIMGSPPPQKKKSV